MKVLIIGIIICLFLTGCAQVEQELEPITLKLKWLHQAQFAGNYVAKEKGFYAEEGLDVKIEEFSFENPTLDAVVEGKADFGITGADELLIAREKGLPIKAIAVIYKINPVCAYSLKDSGIVKPQDFVGKTVGIERASDGTDINIGILYYTMMSKMGVDREQINEITIGYDASELIAGTTDVSTGYIINEPHLAIEQGYEVNTILMAEYGANMYADVLFATEDTIKERPELVEKFVKATLKGWQAAIENEEETVQTVLQYATESTSSHEQYMLSQSIPLIHTGTDHLGWMKEEEWTKAKDILLEQELLKTDQDITEAFDNSFVENIYR